MKFLKFTLTLFTFLQADLTAAQSSSPPAQRPVMTILGIDAGEWSIINYLRDKGKLPNFDKLIKGGAWGTLESIHPMFTPIVWTTIATGKTPRHHGIDGFSALNPQTGAKVPVNRTMRRSQALWNIVSDKGLNALVTAWYATWPAEKIKGAMISDYTWPLKNSTQAEHFLETKAGLEMKDQTYPTSLYEKVQDLFIVKTKENPTFRKRFGLAVKDAPYALKHSYAKDLTYFNIYRRLRRSQSFDLTTLYIQGPDLLSHQFFEQYSKLASGLLGVGSVEYKKGDLILKYYTFIDQMLGVYLNKIREKNETILIVSDHGFEDKMDLVLTKVSDDRYAKKRYWHRKEGIFIANGPNVRRGQIVTGATVFDIAPTALAYFGLPVAADMQGRPLAQVLGRSPKSLPKISSYETKVDPRQDAVKTSPYDRAILQRLNDLGYIQ